MFVWVIPDDLRVWTARRPGPFAVRFFFYGGNRDRFILRIALVVFCGKALSEKRGKGLKRRDIAGLFYR